MIRKKKVRARLTYPLASKRMIFPKRKISIFDELFKCMNRIHKQMIQRTRKMSKINNVNAGQWFLECWILTRWILEYALISNYGNKLSKDLTDLHKLKVKVVFDRIMNEKFSEVGVTTDDIESFLSSATETYAKIVDEQGFPDCLPIIGEVCISGIYEINDNNVFDSFLMENKPYVDEFVIELLDHIDNAKYFWNSFLQV